MQGEKCKEIAIGVFILAFSVVGFLYINPTDASVTEGPGGLTWQTIPLIYSGLLMALAILFLATTIFRGPIPVEELTSEEATFEAEEDAQENAASNPLLFGLEISTARRVAVIAALILYVKGMEAFGFALTTPIFLFLTLYIFGRKKFTENLLVAVIGGAALWLMFAHILRIRLDGNVWDPVSPALSGFLRAMGI